MQFKVMIAHKRLNQMYDGILAYLELLSVSFPNIHGGDYLQAKTEALIAHDRILTDMVELTGRTGEKEYQRQLAQIHMQNIRAFAMAPIRRYR